MEHPQGHKLGVGEDRADTQTHCRVIKDQVQALNTVSFKQQLAGKLEGLRLG